MEVFDSYAKSYDDDLKECLKVVNIDADYFTEYKPKLVKKYCIENHINPSNILDFGCGIGNSSHYLSKMFQKSEIYGIDVSMESIEIAKKREMINATFSTYDGENLLFSENYFDIIFISNVFHHINHDKHIAILKKLKSILKENGTIFFFEHNTLNPITRKIVNECVFDKDAKLLNYRYTKKMFKLSGFTKNKIRFILFIPPKLKKLLFLEKFLYFLPFGGQYVSISQK